MWIELTKEIEEYLESKADNSYEVSAIKYLLDSMIKGHHIIYIDRKFLKKLKQKEYLDLPHKRLLQWIYERYSTLYSCREIIQYKIIVSQKEDIIKRDERTFEVPLLYFYDFKETKLLTENETDCKFFLKIYNYVKKIKKTSDLYDIRFENDSCHGANVKSKIMQNAEGNNIALCILDSDKEYKGGAIGDTYKGANNQFKKYKDDHIMQLTALEVREKENLFTPNLYQPICKEQQKMLEVLSEFILNENIIKYFDVKDGIRYKKYKDKIWKTHYEELINRFKEENIWNSPTAKEEKNEFCCIKGIGEKMCTTASEIFLGSEDEFKKELDKYDFTNNEKNEIRKIRENLSDYIPKYIQNEWERLFLLMFSWGCCIPKNKMSICI